MKTLILGLLKEGKTPPDRRAVLTPSQCQVLLNSHTLASILVEPSTVRVFSDAEYAEAGCIITQDLSACDALMGVKEVNTEDLRPFQKAFFFSHTYKFQPHNRSLLQACIEKNIELIDWELIKDENGQRLIGFGRYAGLVGAYEALRGYGQMKQRWELPMPETCHDLNALIQPLLTLRYPSDFKLVITGSGRVGKGAVEVLLAAGLREVSPADYLVESFEEPVFTVLDSIHYVARKDGMPFQRRDFHAHPEEYKSTFAPYLHLSTLYLPCHYYADNAPAFFTAEEVQKPNCRLEFVGDISCDISGPIPSTIRSSVLADPFYGWDPQAGREVPLGTPGSVGVMAVDNLPCALPRDASHGFGEQFIAGILPQLLNQDAYGILERATECKEGRLMPLYHYLYGFATALDFSHPSVVDLPRSIENALTATRENVLRCASNPDQPTFENTIVALEDSGSALDELSERFFNFSSACTNSEIQAAAKHLSPLLTALNNDILLNKPLFQRVQTVYANRPSSLSPEDVQLLDKTYRRFVRNGALLTSVQEETLRAIDRQLGLLSLAFGEHVLADSEAFAMHLEGHEKIRGLPVTTAQVAAEIAREKGHSSGWTFTLDAPSYIGFMTYAEHRESRKILWEAFATRGAKNDGYDNKETVVQIARLRQERAELLGYASHSHFILEERMAKSPETVRAFLDDLLVKARPAADREIQELKEFAEKHLGIADLQRWDVAFVSEKMKKARFSLDDEALKPYFSLPRVLEGAFAVAQGLYGISIRPANESFTYHPEVDSYEVWDENGQFLAHLLTDWHPRNGKRQGAWMTSYRSQKTNKSGQNVRPVISIVCNFTRPIAPGQPALLTFQEVLTLFHEFGHALHGILAQGSYASLTGTNVLWDFVELPSQIMENWCTAPEALSLFAYHYETLEPLPKEWVKKLQESAAYLTGIATLRQVGFGLLDMAYHDETYKVSKAADLADWESQILTPVEWLPRCEKAITSTAFSHLFSGGYSAGYYSYKWAEVLDADAYSLFEEQGVMNKKVGSAFRRLLEAGGTQDPMDLFVAFRGRTPQPEALLKRAGWV